MKIMTCKEYIVIMHDYLIKGFQRGKIQDGGIF